MNLERVNKEDTTRPETSRRSHPISDRSGAARGGGRGPPGDHFDDDDGYNEEDTPNVAAYHNWFRTDDASSGQTS